MLKWYGRWCFRESPLHDSSPCTRFTVFDMGVEPDELAVEKARLMETDAVPLEFTSLLDQSGSGVFSVLPDGIAGEP